MNKEFFDALDDIEKEKGIPRSYMLEKISAALLSAFKRDYAGGSDNMSVFVDEQNKEIRLYLRRMVVEEVTNPKLEMTLDEALLRDPKAGIGDFVDEEIKTREFGRIAAQTAKQVIIQGIREAERGIVFEEFTSMEHELLNCIVSKRDSRTGGVFLELLGKSEKTEVVLSPGEQVRDENLSEGDRIKVYLVEVKKTPRGMQMLISRTHPGLVRCMFELEVPEIRDGTVEIVQIAREAGSRTKIAVASNDENVDPIGSCVGPKGSRVGNIVAELRGEKIDIIRYSSDPGEFIAAALSPASASDVYVSTEQKACRVIVPDNQLSLAIGKEGQNARLAAKLTGYKIDIKPESQLELYAIREEATAEQP